MKRLFALLLALVLSTPAAAQIVQPTQSISVQDTGTQCATAGTCAVWALINTSPSFTVQITGTFSGTLTFRGSSDNATYFDIMATKVSTGVAATTTTTTGQYSFTNPGILTLRIVGTTINSGGANITLTRGSSSTARTSSGGSGPVFNTLATGDLLYASATNTVSGLTVGSTGQIARSNGTLPVYSTATYPNTVSAGDVVVASGANAIAGTACAAGTVLAGATPAACTTTPNITGSATVTKNAIAATSTDAVILTNTTAAAAGAQQWSPRLRLLGNGWKTDATAASQTTEWSVEVIPVQGAAAPTSSLDFRSSINGASFASKGNLSSAGTWAITGHLSICANCNLQNGGIIYLGQVPTITSGFSTTTPSIVGKASAFAVTIAATPGVTGTVAFNGTWSNIPSVSCTNTITANAVQAVPTTTTVVLNGVWVQGDIIRCIAIGY